MSARSTPSACTPVREARLDTRMCREGEVGKGGERWGKVGKGGERWESVGGGEEGRRGRDQRSEPQPLLRERARTQVTMQMYTYAHICGMHTQMCAQPKSQWHACS